MILYYHWYKILRHYPYWYSSLIRHYPLLLQQATIWIYSHGYSKLIHLYSTPSDTIINYVTIFPLVQQALTLPYSYWYNNLLWSYTYIVTATYYIIILPPIQPSYNTILNLTQLANTQSPELLYPYDTARYTILYPYWYSQLLRYYSSIDTAHYKLNILL